MQETFIIWNSFFLQFSHMAWKGKSFKAFWDFRRGLLAQI